MVTSSAVVGSSAISSLRLAGQRHGDHHALAHAARQLVRKGRQPPGGVGDAHLVQQFDAARAARGAVHLQVRGQRLADLVAHGEAGVQRRHRFLEHHGDVAPDQRAALARRQRGQLLAVEGHAVGGNPRRPRQQAHDGQHGYRLARARFAHDGQHLVAVAGDVDAVDGDKLATAGGEGHAQVADVE
jgi:hypothetical protein